MALAELASVPSMGPLIALLMTGAAIYSFVNAERVTDRVQGQWEGKRMPFPLTWAFGDPPSATHVRRVNLVAAVMFALLLVVGLVV